MKALKVFAKLVNELPDDTEMEVSICGDGSGDITAITPEGKRIVCLTFQQGFVDGNVYDYSKILTDGYRVYEQPIPKKHMMYP